MKRILVYLAAIVLSGFTVSAVVASNSHDSAYRALQDGKIVPLATILDWVEKNYRGYVVEIELEYHDSGRVAIYEVEFITDQGAFIEFYFDARNAKLMRIKGKGAESARKITP